MSKSHRETLARGLPERPRQEVFPEDLAKRGHNEEGHHRKKTRWLPRGRSCGEKRPPPGGLPLPPRGHQPSPRGLLLLSRDLQPLRERLSWVRPLLGVTTPCREEPILRRAIFEKRDRLRERRSLSQRGKKARNSKGSLAPFSCTKRERERAWASGSSLSP